MPRAFYTPAPVQVVPHHHPLPGDSLLGDFFFHLHHPLLISSTWLVPGPQALQQNPPHGKAAQRTPLFWWGVTAAAQTGQIFMGWWEPTSTFAASAASDISFNLAYNYFFSGLVLLD